mmetsp:Transcript_6113/g.10854  ORF Transcript_6113/g.10854 Transcript_6113/m.10854 type:complete len:201 (+) Transcript_6113:2934-3536(+)
MLLRLVALDSNSKDGWYDWRASEIRNHPNGGLHASISAQSRAGANVSFEPASITRPSQSSIAMSASNLFALLNVFLQFAREMNGGAIQSIVFREPMRNFQKWIFHNGVNSLEWAQSPGYYITLFGDLSSIFLVGIAETKVRNPLNCSHSQDLPVQSKKISFFAVFFSPFSLFSSNSLLRMIELKNFLNDFIRELYRMLTT